MSLEFKKFADAWAVHQTVNEYGHLGKLVGVFSTENKANKAAIGQGWYGGHALVEKHRAIVLVDYDSGTEHYYLLDKKLTDVPSKLDTNLIEYENLIKKRALSKLSKEEKEVLGLEEE